MQFETFGPLRVSLDGEELALGSPQQQKLLALLLATPNHAVPTDRLIDEMWSDDPPASARHLVQVYTSRLRLLLTAAGETSRVVREGDAYTIRVRAGEVDSLDLPDRIEAARALLPEDPAGAERLLREVVAGRRGRPFGNLSDESTTLRAEAVRLEELYLGAVAHLYEAQLELGHHQDLIPGLEALTQEHPYRERFWAQRMLALYRSGRQADALRSYQTLRRILGEDLGIEPSSEVRHLEERILLQDVGLLWRSRHPRATFRLRSPRSSAEESRSRK